MNPYEPVKRQSFSNKEYTHFVGHSICSSTKKGVTMLRLGIEAGAHTFMVAAEHGIQGVPISADQLVKDGLEATLAPIRQRGLTVCQIGAFGFNPLSLDMAQKQQQRQVIENVIPMAVEAGCPYIVINGGNYHSSSFGAGDIRNFSEAALDEVARELEPLVALAEQYNAKLSIEPYLKTAIYSPERFLALKKKLPSDALRINIDVTSLYAYHEMWHPDEAVEHICTSLAGHYGLGHIKDVILKDGFHIHIDLAPLGSSRTNWAQVLRLMAPHMPDDSWLILEHVSTPEEAQRSLEILHQAARDASVTLG
jgi:sugar phosphate isomerase/epimerase